MASARHFSITPLYHNLVKMAAYSSTIQHYRLLCPCSPIHACHSQFPSKSPKLHPWKDSFTYQVATCFAFSERNIGNGLQRLLRRLEKCSRNFAGSNGTRRELNHVAWPKKPYISVHHSLCRGLWAIWNARCGQTGRSFHHILWTWALRTLWATCS